MLLGRVDETLILAGSWWNTTPSLRRYHLLRCYIILYVEPMMQCLLWG